MRVKCVVAGYNKLQILKIFSNLPIATQPTNQLISVSQTHLAIAVKATNQPKPFLLVFWASFPSQAW